MSATSRFLPLQRADLDTALGGLGGILREEYVAMLTFRAYGDESTGEQIRYARYYVFAGWVAPLEVWAMFEAAWRDQLAKENIKRFHGTDFADRPEVTSRFVDVITRFAVLGQGAAVALTPIRRFQKAIVEIYGQRRRHEPHNEAFRAFLQFAARRLDNRPESEQVAFVLHRHAYGSVCAAIYQDLIDHSDFSVAPWVGRLGSITTNGNDELLLPLQAADLLAYESWRWKEAGAGVPLREPMRKLLDFGVKIQPLGQTYFKSLIQRARYFQKYGRLP